MNQLTEFESLRTRLKVQDIDMTASLLGSLSLRDGEPMTSRDLLSEAVSNYQEVHEQRWGAYMKATVCLQDLAHNQDITHIRGVVTLVSAE